MMRAPFVQLDKPTRRPPVRYSLVVLTASLAVSLPVPAAQTPNNPYGVHPMLQDFFASVAIEAHLTWANTLTGDGGYAKQLMYPVNTGMTGPRPDWCLFVQGCYDHDLIPVLRLQGPLSGAWVKPTPDAPGDYTSAALAFKNVVAGFPREPGVPLYIEIWNEPNNDGEWSGESNPTEYAEFFVDVAAAIHSLGDPDIYVLSGGLSPGGNIDNLDFIDMMCQAVPAFPGSFDVWASHPYPNGDPYYNAHDGTAPDPQFCIDGYLAEFSRLSAYMDVSDLKVICTETGYTLGLDFGEDNRAEYISRAFRDYWSQWPEVLAVCPFSFCDPYGGWDQMDWVWADSDTTPEGYPTHTHAQYDAVWALAKPGYATGGLSGRVTSAASGLGAEGVTVRAVGGGVATSDSYGGYYVAEVPPGTYTVQIQHPEYEDHVEFGVGIAAAENTVMSWMLEPLDLTPPGPPTDPGTLSGERRVTVLWNAPADADVAGVLVRSSTSAYPAGPTDGDLVCDVAVAPGTAYDFLHTGVTNGEPVYYSLFAYDPVPNYSTSAQVEGRALHQSPSGPALSQSGWALVSVPVDPADPDPAAVFSPLAPGNSLGNSLFAYSAEARAYEMYPGGITAVERGAGYWLHLVEPNPEVTAEGSDPQTDYVFTSPTAGWMLVGMPFDYPVAWSLCSVYSPVEGYVLSAPAAASAGWISPGAYWYDESMPGYGLTPTDDAYLRPWRGYWLYFAEAGMEFTIPAGGTLARLDVTADNVFTLWVNGCFIAFEENWDYYHRYYVQLLEGENVVAVEVYNGDGPYGLIADIYFDDTHIVTGESGWLVSETAAAGWNDTGFVASGWWNAIDTGIGYHESPWTWGYENFADSDATWVQSRSGTWEQYTFYARRSFTYTTQP